MTLVEVETYTIQLVSIKKVNRFNFNFIYYYYSMIFMGMFDGLEGIFGAVKDSGKGLADGFFDFLDRK